MEQEKNEGLPAPAGDDVLADVVNSWRERVQELEDVAVDAWMALQRAGEMFGHVLEGQEIKRKDLRDAMTLLAFTMVNCARYSGAQGERLMRENKRLFGADRKQWEEIQEHIKDTFETVRQGRRRKLKAAGPASDDD